LRGIWEKRIREAADEVEADKALHGLGMDLLGGAVRVVVAGRCE
jgi:hypothetical protein